MRRIHLFFAPRNYWNIASSHRKMSIRLFEGEDHSKLYAKYRPTYPDEVFQAIVQHCKIKSTDSSYSKARWQLAVDVGCGNGQSSVPLVKYFNHVIGLDVSEKQIEQAKLLIKDVDFQICPGENLTFLDTESVDLVTVAQALHWMNAEKFFCHVKRILKPGGSMVVYGYGNCVLDNKEANKVVGQNFYEELLRPYWDKQRCHVENKYHDFILPFPGWYRNDNLQVKFEWSVNAFIGYVSSWSAWQAYNKKHPGNSKLENLHKRLTELYADKTTNNVKNITIVWPVFMLFGTKPS